MIFEIYNIEYGSVSVFNLLSYNYFFMKNIVLEFCYIRSKISCLQRIVPTCYAHSNSLVVGIVTLKIKLFQTVKLLDLSKVLLTKVRY